jgi:hypothetical protein
LMKAIAPRMQPPLFARKSDSKRQFSLTPGEEGSFNPVETPSGAGAVLSSCMARRSASIFASIFARRFDVTPRNKKFAAMMSSAAKMIAAAVIY